jgi:hypothetical protein
LTHVGTPAHIIGWPAAQVSLHIAPAHEHVESPEQVTLHAPVQVTWHVLVPVHATCALPSSVRVHVLPPSQVSVEPAPAERLHVEPPPHEPVEFAPSARLQFDCPSQLEVQPLTQSTLHVFLLLHASDEFDTATAPPSPSAPSPTTATLPPSEHV